MTFDSFSDYSFSALLCLGYITGAFVKDEGYYFGYSTVEKEGQFTQMKYAEFRDSIYSIYKPIYSNAHGYIRNRQAAEKEQSTLRKLSQKEFSKLCQWAFEASELASLLILIIESSKPSLLVMPSGFSVALEGLTDLVVQKNEDKLVPVKDKKLASKLRTELKKTVDTFGSQINGDSINVLKNRIDQINQPTNRSKLIKPFELLNFTLTKEDEEAIEHRNDFLHGRITLSDKTKKFNGEDIKIADSRIYYISMRLYTLLSVLILKSIGFTGKIINHPKVQENVARKKVNEDHFRQV
jgi:hypothetical protein